LSKVLSENSVTKLGDKGRIVRIELEMCSEIVIRDGRT